MFMAYGNMLMLSEYINSTKTGRRPVVVRITSCFPRVIYSKSHSITYSKCKTMQDIICQPSCFMYLVTKPSFLPIMFPIMLLLPTPHRNISKPTMKIFFAHCLLWTILPAPHKPSASVHMFWKGNFLSLRWTAQREISTNKQFIPRHHPDTLHFTHDTM